MTLKRTIPVIIALAAVISLFAALEISSVNAQNITGNETGGNMTAGGNMTNTTAGGNMTSPLAPTTTPSPTPTQ